MLSTRRAKLDPENEICCAGATTGKLWESAHRAKNQQLDCAKNRDAQTPEETTCLQGMLQATQLCQIVPDSTHTSDFKQQRVQERNVGPYTRPTQMLPKP